MAITQYAWQNAVRSSPEITGTRLLVLLTLSTYMTPDGKAHPSIETLMKNLGVKSDKTIRSQLQWARQNGWLEVKRGGRRGDGRVEANEYQASLPVTHITGREETSTGNPDDRCREPLPVILATDAGESPPVNLTSPPVNSTVSTGNLEYRPSAINHQPLIHQRAVNDVARNRNHALILQAIGIELIVHGHPSGDWDWYERVRKTISGDVMKPEKYYVTAIRKAPHRFLPTPMPPKYQDYRRPA